MLVWLGRWLEVSEPYDASALRVVIATARRLGKLLMWLCRLLEVKVLSDGSAKLAMIEAKNLSNSTATAFNVSPLTQD